MHTLLPRLIATLGVLVVLIGFFLGPLLPTPDPTPETRARDVAEERRSRIVMSSGLGVIAMGALYGVAVRLWRRR